MNTLTIAELKRRGMSAIEEGLEKGPIHIMKRNRPSAVIVTEADYLIIQAAKLGISTEKKTIRSRDDGYGVVISTQATGVEIWRRNPFGTQSRTG
jgi:PHD/YefM family antitoxin component YafN of YafNO toxin-antitoxin module